MHNIGVWQNSFCSWMTQNFRNKQQPSPNHSPLYAVLPFLAFQEEAGERSAYIKVFPIHSHCSLSCREMCPQGAVVILLVAAAAPCPEQQGGSWVQPWR